MKRILYHGSESIVETPQFGKGARSNDYGRGFYLTEEPELAKEWACAKNKDGFLNKYEIDMENLSILNLNNKEYNVLNWLALLAKHRTYWQRGSIAEEAKQYIQNHFLLDISVYDIIIGNRSDDSYFSFAQDFVSGVISYEKLSEAMKLGKLGEQVVLKSERAFERIRYIDYEIVLADEYYKKKATRDRQARKEYRQSIKKSSYKNELNILDIMREGIENGDARLL